MGPTAMLLNPYPRDYRQGKFKFKSTERAAKPTDHDLEFIVREGVQGTAMPAFGLLPEVQIKSLVEYVKYLSMRGQTEIRLSDAMLDLSEGEKLQPTRELLIDEILTPIAESWTTARRQHHSHRRRQRQARDGAGGLDRQGAGTVLQHQGQLREVPRLECPGRRSDATTSTTGARPSMRPHKSLDGDIATLDDPGEMTSEEKRRAGACTSNACHHALETDSLPPRNAKPRNLRQGIYRGGRARMTSIAGFYAGINGAPMPACRPAHAGCAGHAHHDEIWNLVDYVLSLPYDPISEPPRQQRAVSRAAL